MSDHKVTRTTPYSELPQWLTVEEAAAHSGKCEWTIRQHIHQGLIPYRRVGKHYQIPRDFFSPDKAQQQVTAGAGVAV